MRTVLLIAFAIVTTSTSYSDNARTGRLAEVAFDRGASDLPIRTTEKTQLSLGKVAAWAMENPDGLVVLDGHADREGPHGKNVRLSLARAQTVQERLLEYGINPDQIVIAAYGERGGKRSVVIWGTRAGMDAVVARTLSRGYVVKWNGVLTQADRKPSPAVAAAVERMKP